MRIFLDDFRNPEDCFGYVKQLGIRPDVYKGDWEIVRNYDEFTMTIAQFGVPDEVSFDHDLGDEHYLLGSSKYFDDWDYYHTLTDREKTGYDCAKFLIQYCENWDKPLPICYVHSMNPVGRENIQKLLKTWNSKIGKGKT